MKHVKSTDKRKPAIVQALRSKLRGGDRTLLCGRVTLVEEDSDGFTGRVFLKRVGERGYGLPHTVRVHRSEVASGT